MEDYEIICLFWKRDEMAIKHTEGKYGGKLSHLAMKILNSREDTAECVNDTLLKTWNTIPPQKPTYFFVYIAKICRHICFGLLDWKNAQKRNAEIVELTSEMQSCISDGCRSGRRKKGSRLKHPGRESPACQERPSTGLSWSETISAPWSCYVKIYITRPRPRGKVMLLGRLDKNLYSQLWVAKKNFNVGGK